jgi:hypothetical protein
VAERKRLRRWAVALQPLESRHRFGYRRTMRRRHPPQHDISVAQAFEPFASAFQDASVGTPIDEIAQCIEVFPDREVDDESVVWYS